MSKAPTVTLRGNARNNFLYGTANDDGIEAGLGDDYLRGYAGDDFLWGGGGSDRFVFERTLAQNGVDFIKDYMYAPAGGELDVLDFSLVGFARNALSRNGGTENGIDNVVRFVDDGEGGGARVEVSLTGAGGESFDTWAVLEGLYAGNLVHFRIGAHTFTRPVQGAPSTGLRYDIGNGDRNGDGVPDEADEADNDDLFDDRLLVSDGEGGTMGAEVLIGDRVRGFGGTTPFTPGVTGLDIPAGLVDDSGGDAVHDNAYQVYYGTYDAATDIFTVTSTPGTTADPTSATHTMVLFDNDTDTEGEVGTLGGMVLRGVYAESQWYIDNGTLQYDMDGFFSLQEVSVLDTENVLYGTGDDESFDGEDGIDIIYAGAGNDRLFGGSSFIWFDNEEMTPPPDGNDWLYGGQGADIFFATNVLEGGIDTIKDFNGTEGDMIALALEAWQIQGALWGESGFPQSDGDGDVPQWWSWSQLLELPALQDRIGFYDIGSLVGSTLEGALQAASAPGGVLTSQETDVNLFLLQHGGKDYLYLDVLGNGYGTEYQPQEGMPPSDRPDVIVEITGAVGLSASNIYVYAGAPA